MNIACKASDIKKTWIGKWYKPWTWFGRKYHPWLIENMEIHDISMVYSGDIKSNNNLSEE